jgi:hypothetical protein
MSIPFEKATGVSSQSLFLSSVERACITYFPCRMPSSSEVALCHVRCRTHPHVFPSIIHRPRSARIRSVGARVKQAGGYYVRWPREVQAPSHPPSKAISCLKIQSYQYTTLTHFSSFPPAPFVVPFILDSPVHIAIYSLFNHPAANATLQLFPHLTGSIIKIFINLLCQKVPSSCPPAPARCPSSQRSVRCRWKVWRLIPDAPDSIQQPDQVLRHISPEPPPIASP